jgi:hypothetical protein
MFLTLETVHPSVLELQNFLMPLGWVAFRVMQLEIIIIHISILCIQIAFIAVIPVFCNWMMTTVVVAVLIIKTWKDLCLHTVPLNLLS